jgi:poly-gamma-glutamate synthesis protein (capsule biosynthesis protein)
MRELARLLFVGDISLGGDYTERYGQGSPNWTDPFIGIHPVFQDADLRIGNLENPLYRSPAPRRKKNLLGAPPESAAALSYLGFTALNLGNNHITDQGAEGLSKTRETLESRGIAPFGAGEDLEAARRPAFAQVDNLSFAFLGYAEQDQDVMAEVATDSGEGCVPPSLDRIEHDIAAARRAATYVVVSLHWGYQYDRYPDPGQIATAHKIIDLGALIVYGHHPHVLQGMERYKNGLILYSLGNFFFPDFVRTDGVKFQFPRESRRTVAVLCNVGASGVQSFSTIPFTVDRDNQMHVLQGRAAVRATRSMVSLSKALDAPDYASSWRSHHSGTERGRRRQEEGLRIRGETASVWHRARTQGVAGSLKSLKGRHVMEMFRLVRSYARRLYP